MVRVQGTMAPVCRLLLILILLVAMRARPALAAPWRAQGAAEDADNGYPPSWMDVASEPPEYPGGLTQVEGFPISWPSPTVAPESNPMAMPVGEDEPASWLNFGMEPPQGGVGAPGAKDQGEGRNMYLESPELLSLMLKELARGLERDRKALQEEGFRGGSSGSAPVPAEEAEEMQATGKPDELCQTATGASHKDDAMAYKIIAAVVGAYAILATMFCCVLLCKWRESKEHAPGASEDQLESGGSP